MACNLNAARKEAGMTQGQLAEKVGVTNDYISMIERGDRTPGFNLAKKIADELNTTVDVIFFADGSNKTFDR